MSDKKSLLRLASGAVSVLSLVALTTACQKQSTEGMRLTTSMNGIVNGKVADGTEAWSKTIIGLASKDDDGAGYTIFCTGSIMSDKTVVTAAHCLDHMFGDNYIVFGLTEKGTDIQARKIVRHQINEKYESWFPEEARDVFDIGVAEFEGGLPTGYLAAEVLEDETLLADGADIILAGYGVTSGSMQSEAGTLRYTTVKIRDSKYGTTEVITDELQSGSCNGDSGGPGLLEKDGKFYLWGTTSRGDSFCQKEGIYTKVTSYREWIKETFSKWEANPLPKPSPTPEPTPAPSATPAPPHAA